MRVLVAGATGALGRRLVPAILAAGHDVKALARRRGPGVEMLNYSKPYASVPA